MLTRLVGLIGDPVSGSRSPRMQNAAFQACDLDWAYVLLPTRAEALERTVAGLVELDFAGANVTTPHKLAAAALCETELVSVNTIVVSDGRVEGHSTDAAILAGLPAERPAIVGAGGAAVAFRDALPDAVVFSRSGTWPPDLRDADLIVNATSEREQVLCRDRRRADARRSSLPGDRNGARCAGGGSDCRRRPRGAARAGRCGVRALDGALGTHRRDAAGSTLLRVSTLGLVTAGESHGPALVAIVTGLPAGLVLDRAAIDADLRRRQQGYGRSPRQQIETDEVQVLAGLRHGRTLGTPLALVIENRDHKNWAHGMSPWPPDGEPSGKGTTPVTTPRPGHADLAGSMKYGLDDVRDALERASARQTAATVAAGAVAKAVLAEIGIAVEGRVVDLDALAERVDQARNERDTIGGVVEVTARGVPPGLGSYATRDDRLDARLAAALMGIQAVKGVEIGDGFALAGLRGSEAHDEIVQGDAGLERDSNRAGGIEAGVSNGEEIVVRAAMKPLPTLMRPLRTVDLATGEPAEALVERSDTAAVEALAVVAEASVAFELARAAREKFGGDALGDFVGACNAYLERIDWRTH